MRNPFVRTAVGACSIVAAAGSARAGQIVVGSGAGGLPTVRVFDLGNLGSPSAFPAYDAGFSGGVRVAAGDVDGDGRADIITGTGPGTGPHVKVFSGGGGSGELGSVFPFAPNFDSGVYVAGGDLDRDGFADAIAGAGPGGGPQVKAYSGRTGTELRSFFAYSPTFTGGVRVAAGDLDGDGFADIITGAGSGSAVRAFSGASGAELTSLMAYGPSFTGGVFVAAGDVDNDGFDDIITGADAGSGPHVKVFSGATGSELRSFFAFPGAFTGGVRVASGDVDGDGFADIITGAGPGGAPQISVFSGRDGTLLSSFLGGPADFTGGVYVAYIPAPGAAALLGLAGLAAIRRGRRARVDSQA